MMAAWLGRPGLACRRLAGPGGSVVALTCEISGEGSSARYVLSVTAGAAIRASSIRSPDSRVYHD
jgi:hypothetical protein